MSRSSARFAPILLALFLARPGVSQAVRSAALPDAPAPVQASGPDAAGDGSSSLTADEGVLQQGGGAGQSGTPQRGSGDPHPSGEVDASGNAVPLSRSQPKRILGLMPNYRSVSGGAVAERPTAKRNFEIANRQAFDYSSFIFLGITSMAAEGLDEHPSLGKGVPGFWGYTWRGFLDKTDGTYQSAFLLPTLLHEDGRYYAMGTGDKWKRLGYATSRVVVTRTYGGRNTFNFAGIGGKVGTQAVSRTYYPGAAATFGVLATKFGYSVARDVGFTVFREFYPDIATHVLHRNP